MDILDDMLQQDAVYWPLTGNDAMGDPTYGSPVQIRCRWQMQIREIKDFKGRDTIAQHRVFVDRRVTPGGVLWQGKLIHLTSQFTPFDNPGAQEILLFGETPTLDAEGNTAFMATDEVLREVRL